jgi:hypothetical protein
VVVAAANPLDRRYSVVALAGLSAEATFAAVPRFVADENPAEVLVLAAGRAPRRLLLGPVGR